MSARWPADPLFPSVEDRVAESTEIWARDLRAVFEHAKDRFGDVTWESEAVSASAAGEGDRRIWGHKAIIYARAPKAFKDRYFTQIRPLPRSPNSLRSPSPLLTPQLGSRPPSPPTFRGPSPSPSPRANSSLSVNTFRSGATARATDAVLRLTHGDTPELFAAQLEWLYTGEGFGDVVEWISAEDDSGLGGSFRDSLGRRGNQADRRDKLGQDLTYMWRSKLYADVRIHLAPQAPTEDDTDDSDDSTDSLLSTAIFTAHRFILASRSPYFASVLLNPSSFRPATADIHLPTPPFTPAALHFCLGYMYAGHLDFSNRSFDLFTAFQIHRAAAYLQLDTLGREIEARIVHDFCHGLECERCHCRRCPPRAARVWRFAIAPDVGAVELAKKARRFVLRAWGECFGRELGSAEKKDREGLVRDVIDGITAANVIAAFKSVETIRARIEAGIRARGREAGGWVDGLESMLEPIEEHARGFLLEEFGKVAEGTEMWDMLSGKGFNEDLLERVCKEVVDAVGTARGCIEAPRIYQAVVSSILLKVDPVTQQTVLSPRSRERQQIEVAKEGILAHIRRRWMQIRDGEGFHDLENWSLKEISDEIEVPVDDLDSAPLSPPSVKRIPAAMHSGIPRTTSRVTSLAAASSSTPKSAFASPRPSVASRSSAAHESATEANGLRRLRLTSLASTSSAASTRSVPARPELAKPIAGPQARSPTAARDGPTVAFGSAKGRANAAKAREASPTPSAKGARRISGPPKPLLAKGTSPPVPSPANGNAEAGPSRLRDKPTSSSPRPSVSPVRTARTTASKALEAADTSSGANQSKSGGKLRPSSPRPSVASVRSARTIASTANTSRPAHTISSPPDFIPPSKKAPLGAPGKPTLKSPPQIMEATQSEASGSRIRPTSNGTTTSVRSRVEALSRKETAPPVPKIPLARVPVGRLADRADLNSRARTTSASTTTSVRSKAPSLAPSAVSTAKSVAQSTASTLRSVSPPVPTRAKTSAPSAATVRVPSGNAAGPSKASATATASRRPASIGQRSPSKGPTTPTSPIEPTTPSSRAQMAVESKSPHFTSAKVNPTATSTSARLRNLSTTSTISRSSTRHPPTAMPSLLPSVRSPSSSTTDEPEARTPRLSGSLFPLEPRIRRDGSSGSDLASPPSSKLPPVSMPRTARKVSSSSTRSTHSVLRPHPASAFDPPRRPAPPQSPPKLEITDGTRMFDGPGVALHVGIPCIVSLDKRRARFRAHVKYIGHLKGVSLGSMLYQTEVSDEAVANQQTRGAWVGIETEDLFERFGIPTLPYGSKEGTHYFHLTPAETIESELDGRLVRQRQIDRIREGLGKKALPFGLGLGGLPVPATLGAEGGQTSKWSASPFVGDWTAAPEKPRAMFVRPSEVVFVMGAE